MKVGYYVMRDNKTKRKKKYFIDLIYINSMFQLKIKLRDENIAEEFIKKVKDISFGVNRIAEDVFVFEYKYHSTIQIILDVLDSYLWVNHLSLLHLDKNRIGGMFMLNELEGKK